MASAERKALELISCALLSLLIAGSVLATNSAKVKALLFYPPFCEECSEVVDEFLFPLSLEYSDALELRPVDISEPAGGALLRRAWERYRKDEMASDVPSVLIGDQFLSGKAQIIDGFRQVLEAGLAAGGVDWPAVPGLLQATTVPDEFAADVQEESRPDRLATALAWTVMAAMLLSLIYAAKRLFEARNRAATNAPVLSRGIPVVVALGLAVTGYLSYSEITQGEPVCGPVGDCLKVQSSPYSVMFGVPMAYWGLVFYLIAMGLWYGQKHRDNTLLSRRSFRALLVLSLFGVLFSIYLTGLELFVIQAVCPWCLASAVLATLLMLIVMHQATSARI